MHVIIFHFIFYFILNLFSFSIYTRHTPRQIKPINWTWVCSYQAHHWLSGQRWGFWWRWRMQVNVPTITASFLTSTAFFFVLWNSSITSSSCFLKTSIGHVMGSHDKEGQTRGAIVLLSPSIICRFLTYIQRWKSLITYVPITVIK